MSCALIWYNVTVDYIDANVLESHASPVIFIVIKFNKVPIYIRTFFNFLISTISLSVTAISNLSTCN